MLARARRPLLVSAAIVLLAGIVGPAGGASAQAAPYHVRIHAVLAADDDGGDAATITPEEVAEDVAAANEVWAGSGVVFDFDPATDAHVVHDTRLNNDCTLRYYTNPFQLVCSKQITADAREAYAMSAANDDEIVVFYRSGAASYTCSSTFACDNNAPNKAFSCRACHYVAMFSSQSSNRWLLAHELGHYLWNTHTFRREPANEPQARQAILDYVNKGGSKSKALEAFDGNLGEGGSDTPPDPGRDFWAAVKGSKCATGPGDGTHSLTVNFAGGSKTYTLAPDRTNVMSYFHCEALGVTSAPSQRTRVKKSVTDWNRGQLIGKTPAYATLKQVWSKKWSGGYRGFAPFMLRGRQHVFAYHDGGTAKVLRMTDKGSEGASQIWSAKWTKGYRHFTPFSLSGHPYLLIYKPSGTTKIVRFAGNGKGTTTVFSGTWTKGYTSFAPFELGGQPHALLYKSGSGAVKIIRINAGGKGVTTVWKGTWTTGYSTIMPFVLGGTPHALLYKKGSGAVKIVRIRSTGKGVTTLWSGKWTKGWSHFVPFDRGHQARFLAYKIATGEVDIDRVYANGKGTATIKELFWSPWLTHMAPVRVPGLWHILTYGTAGGAAALQEVTQ